MDVLAIGQPPLCVSGFYTRECHPIFSDPGDHKLAIRTGTPVYYGAESAATRAFIERLCFPYNKYAKDMRTLFPRRIKTALIYTMNVSEDMIEAMGYNRHFELTRTTFERHFGPCELLVCTDTLQFSDYDKYESERFDKEAKAKRNAEVF
ncbi:MAG TPA: hypothetical protein VLT56_04555, partial [Desulfobacterales bacterium]|nr:hypothetical protein [Desulfobacterales bacterium]